MKKPRILAIVLSVMMIFMALGIPTLFVNAAGTMTTAIVPSKTSVSPGETITVQMNITAITGSLKGGNIGMGFSDITKAAPVNTATIDTSCVKGDLVADANDSANFSWVTTTTPKKVGFVYSDGDAGNSPILTTGTLYTVTVKIADSVLSGTTITLSVEQNASALPKDTTNTNISWTKQSAVIGVGFTPDQPPPTTPTPIATNTPTPVVTNTPTPVVTNPPTAVVTNTPPPTISEYPSYYPSTPSPTPYGILVSSVSISQGTIYPMIGTPYQLTATVLPNDAFNKNVTWTSANTNIADVDATGKVTAKTTGQTTVTATTEQGGFTATCTVKVGLRVYLTSNKTAASPNSKIRVYVNIAGVGNLPSGIKKIGTSSVASVYISYFGSNCYYVAGEDMKGALCSSAELITYNNASLGRCGGYYLDSDNGTTPITMDGMLFGALFTAGSVGTDSTFSLGSSTFTMANGTALVSSITDKTKTNLFYDSSITVQNMYADYAVTGIDLSLSTAQMKVGQTGVDGLHINYLPTIEPPDMYLYMPTITWTSSNESVIKIGSKNTIIAVGVGTAVVSVSGGSSSALKDSCTITVVPPTLEVIKNGTNLAVTIRNVDTPLTKKYQIWTLSQINSDLRLGTDAKIVDQWLLAKEYTLGSQADVISQDNNTITFNIPSFTSSTKSYTVAVRILNGTAFVGELRDTFTPAEVTDMTITKVLADGIVVGDNPVVLEAKSGGSANFEVKTNIAGTLEAMLVPGNISLISSGSSTFTLSTEVLSPGKYKLVITASYNGNTATKTVDLEIYTLSNTATYASLTDLLVSKSAQTINVAPTIASGSFKYIISEEGYNVLHQSAVYSATQVNNAGGTLSYNVGKPGVYEVRSYAMGSVSADDSMLSTVTIPRTGGGSNTISLTADANLSDVAVGTPITFTAEATIPAKGVGENLLYAFFRVDASGIKCVRDYSYSNALQWTPNRVGNYYIQVRAKGDTAGSYEVQKSTFVSVTSLTTDIAKGVVISMNDTEVQSLVQAHKPVLLKLSATASNGEDLLYKVNVGTDASGIVTLQDYSANANVLWTPGKAGTYKIEVLVKNTASFGWYDAKATFVITVS